MRLQAPPPPCACGRSPSLLAPPGPEPHVATVQARPLLACSDATQAHAGLESSRFGAWPRPSPSQPQPLSSHGPPAPASRRMMARRPKDGAAGATRDPRPASSSPWLARTFPLPPRFRSATAKVEGSRSSTGTPAPGASPWSLAPFQALPSEPRPSAVSPADSDSPAAAAAPPHFDASAPASLKEGKGAGDGPGTWLKAELRATIRAHPASGVVPTIEGAVEWPEVQAMLGDQVCVWPTIGEAGGGSAAPAAARGEPLSAEDFKRSPLPPRAVVVAYPTGGAGRVALQHRVTRASRRRRS